MSLGALDFGLIVDGAVIVVEACMFQLHLSHQKKISQLEMDGLVYNTSTKMRNATVFGVLIILVVYLPIFTLEGIEGKMFKPMAQTVAFALLGAFILSLTYIPMMSSLFLSKKISHKKNISDRMMDVIENIHQKYLIKVLKFPKMIISIVLILLGTAIFTLTRMGGEFIPTIEEGDFALETRVLVGSNINTTIDVCLKAAHILKKEFPEVEKVIGKIGSGEIPTDPMPMEAADLMIILKDQKEWTSAKTYNELSEKMSQALVEIPGVTFGFQYPVQMRFNELMTGSKQDVACKIYGENLDTLSKYAQKLGDLSKSVSGTKDIYVESITGLPQVIVRYKRGVIAQYGLNISDINKIINTAFAGQSAGMVFEDEKRFDLVVRLAGEKRMDVKDVQNLLIPTPQGNQIPLNQVASVEIEESINQIQRDDAKRRIIVGFNIGGRDVESIVNEIRDKVDKDLKLPKGYYVQYGGAFKNLVAAKNRLSIAVPLSLMLIFILLFFAFNSIRQGLLIFSAIPLSAIGGIFFLSLRGMPFSISAGIGFIALFGISVLNGIVLISEFNRIRANGSTNLINIVLKGTKVRLRPVLMTAFVASLGFLPMAITTGTGGEVQKPLATVVIGGLMIATFLTIFVLPVLYVMFERRSFKKLSTKPIVIGFFILISSFLFVGKVSGQKSITLQQAIDTALKNNLTLKNVKLQSEYQKKLRLAVVDIPQANLTGEYGQFNSNYKDTKFGISQGINFPTVYKKQKILQNENYKSSLLQTCNREVELKKEVTSVYYQLIYLEQKRQLLSDRDSLYKSFLQKSTLRFDKGESNILEKTVAQTQQGEISNQLMQIKTDIEMVQLQFQLLLNSNTVFIPSLGISKMSLVSSDSSILANHPQIQLLKQEKNILSANTSLEKSKLLPNLNLGYYNSSIQGMGADNILYPRSSRFSTIQFGIGIPLFYSGVKARVNASKIMESITENNYQIGLQNIRKEYQSTYKKYQQQLQMVNYFEQSALPNAKKITETATLQFINGDINYLDWLVLINNSTTIQSNYIDIINSYNETIIQLNFLTNK
jgi:cobalt-zinc-cadmium resistance protein CzcA